MLIGASGSGKSTLLRCINHLEISDHGTIWLDGAYVGGHFTAAGKWVQSTDSELAHQRRKIGMVFQLTKVGNAIIYNTFYFVEVLLEVAFLYMIVIGLIAWLSHYLEKKIFAFGPTISTSETR